MVVKDINLNIGAQEKIGLCGRTGADKSSLILALFRMIEPVDGKIIIGGEDITQGQASVAVLVLPNLDFMI